MIRILFIYICLLVTSAVASPAAAQDFTIRGTVANEEGEPIPGARLYLTETRDSVAVYGLRSPIEAIKSAHTGEEGQFEMPGLAPGDYILTVFFPGKKIVTRRLEIGEGDVSVVVRLTGLESTLGAIRVGGSRVYSTGITRMRSIEGVTLSEAKKNEVLLPRDMAANLATNNARQVYGKVPGLNIWQNSDAGVQTSLGARGLSPKRNSHFNTRQNGYDIAADALGYPESYYTPPTRALRRIEVIRGAASLQYGTQFGGMVNYVFKDGPENDKLKINSAQSAGSFGLLSSFNSVGGTLGDASYYGFYQYKTSKGWRPHSGMDQHTAYGSVTFEPTSRWTITPEFTYMYYLAQQPGGLTDREFERDPWQSNRERNWFRLNWNLIALKANYKFSERTEINTRFFGLKAGRDAVGNLQRIDRMDRGGNRDLLKDGYRNWGNESRFLHRYELGDQISYLLAGVRYYNGFTHRRQGEGSDGQGPDFRYMNQGSLKGSDYDLPSKNRSVFLEKVFNLSSSVSVTGGVRFENIQTGADGYYRHIVKDLAGNVLEDERINEQRERNRSFVFYGTGFSYNPSEFFELYANYAQNYRAINFNDIRVDIGNLQVDPDIRDEHGFNLDVGIRGRHGRIFDYDVSLFYLSYQDRIGTVLKTEPNPRFNGLVDRTFRYRTNVADARIYGLESFAELDLLKLFANNTDAARLSVFSNLALIQGTYVNAEFSGIEGNAVEHVPNVNWKTGLSLSVDNLKMSYQFSYISEHFSDATNARRTPSAVAGIIPSYHVMDLSAEYRWRRFRLEAGINNLTDHRYFTRRATGYPGPGIIPAKPRNGYVSVGIQF